MSHSIKTITEQAKYSLHNIYTESEIKILIRVIFEALLDWDYTNVVMHYNNALPTNITEKCIEIITRLSNNEPIQYIVGYEYFMGNKFYLNNATLIPRPETEELVQQIIDSDLTNKDSILDIGTGSGIIAISLAQKIKNSKVTACDISPKALECAKRSAKECGVSVDFIALDIFKWEVAQLGKFNIIVSNPPYITENEKSDMEAKVLNFEPHQALFVPNNSPLLFYECIALMGRKHLHPNGALWFEINRAYGKECCDMLAQMGYINIELKQDFYGNDRIISAIWRG